jgi:hypothetical protein
MKRVLLGMTIFGVLVLGAFAQGNDRGETTLVLDGGKVSIDYGRPMLKGRDLEGMISVGEEWRMGADTATTLTTEVGLKFGDKTVSQGKYVLKAKLVDKEKWHLLIQNEDKSTVAEVPLSYQKSDNSVEKMTITLEKEANGGKFTLQWGKLSVSTNFRKA